LNRSSSILNREEPLTGCRRLAELHGHGSIMVSKVLAEFSSAASQSV
jgi:hypothetical protein